MLSLCLTRCGSLSSTPEEDRVCSPLLSDFFRTRTRSLSDSVQCVPWAAAGFTLTDGPLDVDPRRRKVQSRTPVIHVVLKLFLLAQEQHAVRAPTWA